jgi:hypothetical protein
MRKLYYKNKLLIRLSSFFENRRLFTPLQLCIYTLKDYRLWPEKLIALDAFCQTGLQWTRIFYGEAEYIEMWDIDPVPLKFAKKEFPKAVIKCGDSIDAFKNNKFGRQDFNFVMIDTPIPFRFGPGQFEHFDFFEQIFLNTARECVIILDVVPDMGKILSRHPNTEDFINEWKIARQTFYGVADGHYISPDTMIDAYDNKVKKLGHTVRLNNYNARNSYFGFIILAVSK